ncbi:TetR/AcrR family transcriptional regulator [Pseudomaricurvus sp. HS19]|uniref:TetR/AcrR family transcriptional regulator n=1 Tax=Pseudomaricurvus sp. HS19 TaxID=2692626 RepID=UPI001370A4E3|nr:TetR/AcrR family transcriptional regulator [Pseudomaricurvus sp. HS19]MYM64170.1 TetR family transcriptional regulator [Pseudomaricurvus sp. HS19]
MKADKPAAQKRHKCFEETHLAMIETAVRLISEKGLEALSIAAVTREMGMNRTTFYYHFESRDALINEVKVWSAEKLAEAFDDSRPQRERIDYITRFVLENPDVVKLWIEELITGGDVRNSYPHWDALVNGIAQSTGSRTGEDAIDPEVFSVILLTSAIVGPLVFRNSVDPGADIGTIVERFRGERVRQLKEVDLLSR